MASSTTRQAASLLSLAARPRSLRFIPTRQIVPSTQRCVHQDAEPVQVEAEQKTYERKPERLPYTHSKRFENGARPQPRAPFGMRVRRPYVVNDDPKVLDAMYTKLFGKDLGLAEEIKWQAITHKSFDHGRQPFNEKLRFLGKRLLQMHASFHLLSSPLIGEPVQPRPWTYQSLEGVPYEDPEVFKHEDYKTLENVTRTNIDAAISTEALMPLIVESGLAKVMRWKPAETNDLVRSGEALIATDCLYAVIGAVALQKGGNVAEQFIKERVLKSAA